MRSALPPLCVVFPTWEFDDGGRVCHAAQSFMIDSALGGFSFRAFCRATGQSDEVEVDVADVVGCAECQRALKKRTRDVHGTSRRKGKR